MRKGALVLKLTSLCRQLVDQATATRCRMAMAEYPATSTRFGF